MTGFSKTVIVGNLTKDADVITLDNAAKTQIANFRMAVNSKYTDSQGNLQNDAVFIDVKAYGKIVATIGKYFTKGRPILVEGRLAQDEWQDKVTNAKRSKLYIKMTDFRFIGNNGENSQNTQSKSENKQTTATADELDGLGLTF